MPLPINELVQKDLRVVGSLYGSANTVLQIPRLLELYQAGRLPLDRLLGTEYRLDDINVAFARLPTESVGRGLIVMGELVMTGPAGYATYPSLRDRTVFITGGATGIGAELVAQFARQGARVGFVDIQDAAAADAGRRARGRARAPHRGTGPAT